jgi:hypothetical protein
MIPTITDVLYELHHEKDRLQAILERRQSIRLLIVITLTLAFCAFLWLQ